MILDENSELRATDDGTVAHAIQYADPMALRGLLFQLTGDRDMRSMEVTKRFVGWRETMGVANDGDVALIRAKAACAEP